MSMYTLAGKIILKADIQGIIIDAAQVQVNATRFGRAPITRSPTQVEEWFKELTQYWLPLAESCSRQDSWPMNDTACGRYGGCQFRGVCGKSPEVREQWLKASFSKRVWDPLRVRGDI